MIAPFEQTRFERETGITSYYFPKDSAPYYSLVEKYSNQLSKVVGDRGFYIEPNCTINPKRPTILNPLPVRREIYEADTGYGKTMRLLKIASESLQVCGNRDIREKILNESVICPFFIDFESMSSYRDDSLLLLLAQSIHWSVKLSTRKSKLFSNAQAVTTQYGYHVLSAFNSGLQDLSGHAQSFSPTLLTHEEYVDMYKGWNIISSSNLVQEDIHPHNRIPHSHSITRILAQKL